MSKIERMLNTTTNHEGRRKEVIGVAVYDPIAGEASIIFGEQGSCPVAVDIAIDIHADAKKNMHMIHERCYEPT